MEKTLYRTLTVNDADSVLTFKYYITKTILNDYMYYGVLIEGTTATRHITGIFPYDHDAKEFADMLYNYQITPVSLTDTISEYIIEKVVS